MHREDIIKVNLWDDGAHNLQQGTNTYDGIRAEQVLEGIQDLQEASKH